MANEARVAGSIAEAGVSETIDCDIVVCGTGTAGTCALLRASELGLKAVALETNAYPGGSSRFAEGVFGVGDRFCQEQGMETTAQEIFDAAANYAHYGSNGPVLHAFWIGRYTARFVFGNYWTR